MHQTSIQGQRPAAAAFPATAVLQDQAKRWMDEQAPNCELVTSQIVLAEAGRGDPDAAGRRLEMLGDIPVLDDNPDTDRIADALVARLPCDLKPG